MTTHGIFGACEGLFLTRERCGVVLMLGLVTPEQAKDKAIYGEEAVSAVVVFVNRHQKTAKRIGAFSCN